MDKIVNKMFRMHFFFSGLNACYCSTKKDRYLHWIENVDALGLVSSLLFSCWKPPIWLGKCLFSLDFSVQFQLSNAIMYLFVHVKIVYNIFFDNRIGIVFFHICNHDSFKFDALNWPDCYEIARTCRATNLRVASNLQQWKMYNNERQYVEVHVAQKQLR